MLATLTVESLLLVYTFWRYKLNTLTRLALLSLAALGTFQLCEYRVCTGYGLSAEEWSRLGYVAITILPPLGLHILHVLAGKSKRNLIIIAYLTMAAFVVYFLTYHAAFISYRCTGNYVIFQIGARPSLAYGLYYYGWLFTAIGLGVKWTNQLQKKGKLVHTRLQTVRALIVGYLIFLVPTALANSIKSSTRRGIPSVMCGFAVLFALILVIYILPRANKLQVRLRSSGR
jgi:low temperature requirement protein LtrA